MVKSCSAIGCTNRSRKGSGISFYRFPVEPEKHSQWIAALRRESWKPKKIAGCAANILFPVRRVTILFLQISFLPCLRSFLLIQSENSKRNYRHMRDGRSVESCSPRLVLVTSNPLSVARKTLMVVRVLNWMIRKGWIPFLSVVTLKDLISCRLAILPQMSYGSMSLMPTNLLYSSVKMCCSSNRFLIWGRRINNWLPTTCYCSIVWRTCWLKTNSWRLPMCCQRTAWCVTMTV